MNASQSISHYSDQSELIDLHANALIELVKKTGDNLEGSCFTLHQTTTQEEKLITKRINLFAAAKHGPKIFELGFNAGHSGLLLLLGCHPGSTVEFLDLGGHPYVVPCFQYLQGVRPEIPRSLVLGNSRDALPYRVLKQKESDLYDVIHMDGGHAIDCVVNDMILLYQLLKPGGWMIIDDADGHILQEIQRYLSLGLFTLVQGQLQTEVYPHLILSKPERSA